MTVWPSIRKGFSFCFVLAAALAAEPAADGLRAQETSSPPSEPPQAAVLESEFDDAGLAVENVEEGSQRTSLNLLGQVDASSGEGRRNENVSVTLIDNNVLKELNRRMGTTATIISEFDAERRYFGKEYGGSPSSPLHVNSGGSRAGHGTFFWTHSNSLFSARSFFQVGGVQPARTNNYGGTFTTPLWEGANLTLTGGQRKNRGQVNGNILVPAANERTPTATDPATLAVVERILAAYPSELPNRTDINPRALNTNAPQNIDDNNAGATLSQSAGDKDQVVFRYNLTLQDVDAFQLVGGQNPNTMTKNHDARTTWTRTWNAATTTDFSVGFNRVSSVLSEDETSPGFTVFFSRALDSVGPTTTVPLDRVQNTFRYAGRVQQTRGNHTLNAGFNVARRQVNGFESNGHLGSFSFRADFGQDRIQNFLSGRPSQYRRAVGNTHRGFRVWRPSFFLGDTWRASQRLTLNFGVRHELSPAPTEVNGLSEIPFDCDCNNIAPSFGFAYRISDKWAVLRASYGLHYGQIFPATYMQTRFNPPDILNLNINVPSLADPLGGFSEDNLDPNQRSDFFLVDPDLVVPYSHQYNFTWQLQPYGDWTVELGYVGSRSHKLLTTWWENRGRSIEGVESTTSNTNERRLDPRYSDVLHTLNGSRAYYDAAKVTLRVPRWAGLSVDASYWWSKSIDLGADYTNTAYGRDSRNSRSPSEFEVHQTMRGLSNFDQPHAFLINAAYLTPSNRTGNRIVDGIVGGWQMTSVMLIKSGSPFTLRTGSDSPGFGNVDGASSDRPNVVDPSVLLRTLNNPDTSRAMLPREAFGFPTVDQFAGNLGRNTFRKDGVWNVNVSLSRRFPLRGDMSMEFRAESLNFFNHPQFAQPGRSLNDVNFGEITNTLNDGRAFQFTLNLNF